MEQKNNHVGGSLAGRDINNNQTTTNNYTTNAIANSKKTQIELLYERLKQEVGQQQGLKDFVDDLQHYMGKTATVMDRSLAEKLTDTGRADLVRMAEELKEHAAKNIMRSQSSPAAQDIFAYVLSELHTKYVMHVSPLVVAGSNRSVVDAAMEKYVVQPIVNSHEPSSLNLNYRLISALLFYLAGNCHIQWD